MNYTYKASVLKNRYQPGCSVTLVRVLLAVLVYAHGERSPGSNGDVPASRAKEIGWEGVPNGLLVLGVHAVYTLYTHT